MSALSMKFTVVPQGLSVLVLCIGLGVSTLRAQPLDSETVGITLSDAIQQALQHNSDFRIASLQVDAAMAQLKIAREFPNPTLGLSTSKISTDGTPEGTFLGNSLLNRAYDSIVSLNQLFLIAKRGVQRDAATAGLHAAQFQKADAHRLLVQSVTQAYAAALAADEEAAVLTAAAAKLRREANIAADRFKAGDLSSSDKARLEIAADQDELSADAQRASAKTAIVTLETLLGHPKPDGTMRLADTLERLVQGIPPELEAAPVETRPDLAAATESLSQAEANLTLQRRQKIPDVTVSVEYERNPPISPPGQLNTVGFGLSLPLPLWSRFDGEVLAARAARDQAQAQLDKVRIQVSSEVASARVAFHEASERARRYKTSLLPKSTETTKSVAYAYEKGGAALVDLLEAERSDSAIHVAEVQSEADTAATGIALLSALGHISDASEYRTK
jgi:cobalt-zinc-cadmium efflux system outer membrane protein